MTDLSTLLAELDAAWNAVGPLHLEATDEGIDIADAGLRCLAEVPDRLGVTPQARDGIVALVNAYPALKEGIAQLQRERDEARREADAHRVRAIQWNNEHVAAEDRWVTERDALRALVARQREALRDISEHLPCDLPCKMKPAQGKCGECGAYRFETWCAGCTARAALATEEA